MRERERERERERNRKIENGGTVTWSERVLR
jgi:hypothetical protein